MVLLIVTCLGILCVKGGLWLISGCIVLAKLLNLPEFHFSICKMNMKASVLYGGCDNSPQIHTGADIFQKMAIPYTYS